LTRWPAQLQFGEQAVHETDERVGEAEVLRLRGFCWRVAIPVPVLLRQALETAGRLAPNGSRTSSRPRPNSESLPGRFKLVTIVFSELAGLVPQALMP